MYDLLIQYVHTSVVEFSIMGLNAAFKLVDKRNASNTPSNTHFLTHSI